MTRIKFRKGYENSRRDVSVFKRWEDGTLTTLSACDKLAKNNGIQEIPIMDFLDAAAELGYKRGRRITDDECEK